MDTVPKAIIFLCLIGLIVAGYSFSLHYSDGSSFCNVNDAINCDKVNKGKYSEFPVGSGIPVSLEGMLGYLFIGLIAWLIGTHKEPTIPGFGKVSRKELYWLLAVVSIAGLGFTLYLTYLEFFVIHAICILCVTSQLIMLSIAILSILLLRKTQHI